MPIGPSHRASPRLYFRYLAAAAVLASALAAAPARAEYETAVADYEQGAYDAAYEEFRRLANLGDDRSRRFLQRMRDEGLVGAVRPSSKGDATDSRQGAASTSGSRSTARGGGLRHRDSRDSLQRDAGGPRRRFRMERCLAIAPILGVDVLSHARRRDGGWPPTHRADPRGR